MVVNNIKITADNPNWLILKDAVHELQTLQESDGSIANLNDYGTAENLIATISAQISELEKFFPHDKEYLKQTIEDLNSWAATEFGKPDFYKSILLFHPAQDRENGKQHLVLFPMNTQNGSPNKYFEAVLIEIMWPEFIEKLEANEYGNKLFLPIKFIDFTSGYDTHSAVLFPETVSMSEIPDFTWGAIFQDREAARFRKVVKEAANITHLNLPVEAQNLLADQDLAEKTFIMWDLIHDRTHMSGDLPFDPFMIKQRMPFFLYGLEELRCDLTAFKECVKISRNGNSTEEERKYARLVQYAIIFDRIFRFAINGTRTRNYDAVAGQLLFAWLHKQDVIRWTNNSLSINWETLPEKVILLGDKINHLYWSSIDKPKINHWLTAYNLVAETLTPHAASKWAQGPSALPLTGEPKELINELLDDEFPLSMFYEALQKKMLTTISETKGIRA